MKGLALVAAALAGLAALAVAIWLAAPLIVNRTVNEAFPDGVGAPVEIGHAGRATVPSNMTRAEVEQVMAGLAKVESAMDEAMPVAPTAVASGEFQDADRFHRGTGRATIYNLADGGHLLRLSDFRVTNGPDLHVLIAWDPSPASRSELDAGGYADLGKLKGNIGNQNYAIPGDVDIAEARSVVIYCMPFHVVFSVASLTPAAN